MYTGRYRGIIFSSLSDEEELSYFSEDFLDELLLLPKSLAFLTISG
jgi:hypothetical protein